VCCVLECVKCFIEWPCRGQPNSSTSRISLVFPTLIVSDTGQTHISRWYQDYVLIAGGLDLCPGPAKFLVPII